MAADPEVWLVSNGPYWKAVWTAADGSRVSRSLGSKAKYSRRQARVLARAAARGAASKDPSAPRLSDWLERYEKIRTDVGDSTRRTYREAGAYLLEHFDNDPTLERITRADAAEWREALGSGELTRAMNSALEARAARNAANRLWRIPRPATVARHVRAAKLMFGEAVSRDLIPFNPFERLSGNPPKVLKDWREVTAADMARILEACPSSGWRALFGLCRFAGLRLGEALRIRWHDIDWQGNRMRVNADVTLETTKKRRRTVPLEPAHCPSGLTRILRDALEAAPAGSATVCGISVNNVRRSARGILRRSGVGEYPKPFHTLRKCCETEWAQRYPQHVVSDWIGHDITVSQAHYLRVPEELYAAPSSVQIGHAPPPEARRTAARGAPDPAGNAGKPRA